MRITPLDVRKQEFGKSMRGFDCDEVRGFLNTLADEYEAVLVDNKQIRERTLELEDKLEEYQRMEKHLRDTLMTAERLTQETRETAAREGELIIRDAEMKARGVLEECRLRTEELRRELTGLRKEKETYLARFRSLAEAQIQFVDSHRSDFEDFDRRLTDIVDAVATRSGPAAPGTRWEAPAPAAAPAPSAWSNPYVAAPAVPGAPYAAPALHTAPVPPAAPAPAQPAAPLSANDIWRSYTPSRQAQGAPAPNAPPYPQPAPAFHSQASLNRAPVNPYPAPSPDEDLNGVIAHTLAEVPTPAPVPGPESNGGQGEPWRIEPVVTEVTNV